MSSSKINLDLQVIVPDEELPSLDDFQRWVAGALAGRNEPAELVIRIVDEAESAELNQQYRHKAGSTNILSFPFQAPPQVTSDLLGDLVICAPVVLRQMRAQQKTAQAHWAHMVVHGVLHLLGYDHTEVAQATEMENLEIGILAQLGFPDPYT